MLKEPRRALKGRANLKEGGLMSVSMINSTLREWVFVRVSAKIITGSGGYRERRYIPDGARAS